MLNSEARSSYLPDFITYFVTCIHSLRHPTFNIVLPPNLRE
jgi:hypothetical protein